MGRLQQYVGRVRALSAEIARFGTVGVVSLVLDFSLFNWLHSATGLDPLSAKAISTTVAALFAFSGNRWWAFRDRARSGLLRELPIFFVLNLVGLAIAEAVLGFSYYALSLHGPLATNSSLVAGGVLGTLFRFWAYKRWVFLHPDAVVGIDHDSLFEDELESIVQL